MSFVDKMMLKLDRCCCGCCNLRTGTLILLWLSLISTIFNLLALFVPLPERKHVHHSVIVDVINFQWIALVGISSAFALYGIAKRKPSYIKPYVYVNFIETAYLLIGCIILLVTAIFSTNVMEGLAKELHAEISAAGGVFNIIFISLLAAVINWYYTSVVWSYYRQFKAEVEPHLGGDFGPTPSYDFQQKA